MSTLIISVDLRKETMEINVYSNDGMLNERRALNFIPGKLIAKNVEEVITNTWLSKRGFTLTLKLRSSKVNIVEKTNDEKVVFIE